MRMSSICCSASVPVWNEAAGALSMQDHPTSWNRRRRDLLRPRGQPHGHQRLVPALLDIPSRRSRRVDR
jgi:hypothetical protein